MAKHVYPAILEPNELGGYCVHFPDIQGAYTHGADLAEAIEMAQDVLCLMLYNCEMRNDKIPPPSPVSTLDAAEPATITLVACDTNYYKRYFANKSVNKTVTIPAWLNHEAEQAGINFSQVLRTGLEELVKKNRIDLEQAAI